MPTVKKRSNRFFLTVGMLGVFALLVTLIPQHSVFGQESRDASFDPEQRPLPVILAEEEAAVDKTKRMVLVGAGCFGIFGTILILFGYFQLNHATRGFYSGRLQSLSLALIAILLGVAFWIGQRFGM